MYWVKPVLIVLILATSGCLNGEETEAVGDEAIQVNELSITPSTISKGATANVNLQIENVGNIPAVIPVDSGLNESAAEYCSEEVFDEDVSGDITSREAAEYTECISRETEDEDIWEYDGDKILTDSCRDMLDIEHFDVTAPGGIDADQYMLAPGDQMLFTWQLSSEDANVPIHGYTCNLRMEVPFDYRVTAYRQLRFLEDRNIEGVPSLDSFSSQGPKKLEIDTSGSTYEGSDSVFVDGDPAAMEVRMENQRRSDDETGFTGIVESQPPEIETTGFQFEEDCPPVDKDEISMLGGESETITCHVDDEVYEDMDGMETAEIQAWTDYTYIKTLGSQPLEIEYAEN